MAGILLPTGTPPTVSAFPPFVLAVMGTTASGKTALAEALADRTEAVLVNADAFQVYRGLDIGTAKPRAKERYALLDIRDPHEQYGVGEFVQDAQREIDRAIAAERPVILVGGTGLYLRALMNEYRDLRELPDPELRQRLAVREREEGPEALVDELRRLAPEVAAAVDVRNPVRVRRALERVLGPGQPIRVQLPNVPRGKVALWPSSAEVDGAIRARLEQMMQNGWYAEVADLRRAGVDPGCPAFRAIGYQVLSDVFDGRLNLDEARERIVLETRRYAKRQRTWLRGEEELHRFESRREVPLVDDAMHWIVNTLLLRTRHG